jgi:hypothetical protein
LRTLRTHTSRQSEDALPRELALVVFLSLTEELGDLLRPHFGTLGAIFGGALGDACAGVRCGALRAIAALAGCVQSEAEAGVVAALVQPMLAAGRAAVAAADEECAQLLFSVLDDLVESPAPLLKGHLPGVLELCVGVATEARVAAATRASALSLVAWVCNYKVRACVRACVRAACLFLCCTQQVS